MGAVQGFFLQGFTEMDVQGRVHKGSPRLNLHLLTDLDTQLFYICYLIFQAKQPGRLTDEGDEVTCLHTHDQLVAGLALESISYDLQTRSFLIDWTLPWRENAHCF